MKSMPKQIGVLLTAILLVLGLLGMTAFAANTDLADEPVCYEHGDVNSDGNITGDDAVYLLFASFGDMFGDEYQLTQDGDLDGDGEVTGDDAVYLLFASFGDMFGDQYTLNGTVHNYYDPIWIWNTEAAAPAAQVSLKCACGENHTITEGITITAGTVVDPTCVAPGSKEYAATVVFEDATYENSVTVTVPALGEDGHTIVGEPTCEEGVKCQYCDYTIPALGHSYVDNGEKVEGCKHTALYKCACGSEIEGDVYYTHSYTAVLLEEATCSKTGKKQLNCACGDTKEEIIPVNPEFHVWGEAVTENGVTTQTCVCGETKTIVVMSEEGVSAEALKDSEVQLDGGTAVSLDESTAQQLDAEKTVVIKVEQVDKDETGISEEEKAQIGDNAVYDFSMEYSDGTPINSFAGEVTVALPYTLQDGDDVNAIDVWYIADDGSVECVKGVYSNNYVTFKTNHFSYYTVTRLTPEQRCSVYGHTMVEHTKAATCTEDGYHKVFCQRCGLEEKNEVKAMLGHDYQKDTQLSVDATCNAPGKLATQCSHCGHKRLQEVKQLSHKWNVETVAPTCSAKGYDKRTCSLCGAEKIENEKEALGHNYSKESAVWSWSDDHSKATVTLTCTNDEAHTKELNAVVTYKGGNACVGGQVTYTATASLNKNTYTTDTTGEIEGIGHTPGSAWASSDEKHYHICSVCGEPVGEAAHDWNRKVITAATCGKEGAATDTCTVCGKEKTVVLPATGNHNFNKGVCSVCGYVEGSCDHKKLTIEEIDLSEYGVCGGVVYVRVCECGQVTTWYGCDVECDLQDEDEEINEEQGYAKYASVCPDCGLRLSAVQRRVLDQDNCCGYYVLDYRVAVGSTVVVETHEESAPSYHPLAVEHDPVNLADYGLCEGTLTNTTCYCGLRSEWDGEIGCDLSFSDDEENFSCPDCGATGTNTIVSGKEGCQYKDESVVVFYLNGKQVFTATARYIHMDHDYQLADYELQGATCEEGLIIHWVCADCDDTTEEFYRSCATILEERVIDTSATGSCTPGIRITSCPCGNAMEWDFIYDDERTDHQWDHQYIPSIDNWADCCTECGFMVLSEQEEMDPSAKDENCYLRYDVTFTYTNGEGGDTFTWKTNRLAVHHNNVYSYEMKGDSCEDGVTVTRSCSDCGMNDSWTTYYHEVYHANTLDLTEYGYCCGRIYQESCACGQSGYLYTEGGRCELELIAGDEGFEEARCVNCGITEQIRWSQITSDEPCVYLTDYEHTYLKDGQVLGTIGYTYYNENHRFVYELVLADGAESCDDGYSVYGSCLDCGYSREYTSYNCEQYIISREIVSTEDMCGVMELVTEACACGKYHNEGIRWQGDTRCEFYGEGVYIEEYDAWQYFCVCGASRISRTEESLVEGETCLREVRHNIYYFAPNGELIAHLVNSEIGYSHDYLAQPKLLGETCEDGWTCSWICADCGETVEEDGVGHGHELFTIARECFYDAEDICGPFYVYRESCACGEHQDCSITNTCRISWNGDAYTCKVCGISFEEGYDAERRPGTCLEDVTITYTFIRDGQTVATASNEFTRVNHEAVYQLILLGETCEDGYRVVESCAFCDYEYMREGTYRGHGNYILEYYEAPEGSCGGAVTVYGCACGKERSVRNDLNCSMSGQYEYVTDENGIEHTAWTQECESCDMSIVSDQYCTPGEDDCHLVELGIWNFYFDELTLKLTEKSTTNNHLWEAVRAQFSNEGSTDCNEGVDLDVRCSKCGEEQEWITSSHYTFAGEDGIIDLAEYGSVCGAKLEVLSCLCGKINEVAFSDDTQCDIGENWTDVWIEGALLREEYYTTSGWNYITSEAYECNCAVTDPACGLRIRMACYWLNENCTAVEYETWQLGYDPENGTCQKEITITTGRTRTYHNYEAMPDVEGTEDGLLTREGKYCCTGCDSYYFDKYYYSAENENAVKRVFEVVNALNNGENKRYTRVWEYMTLVDLNGDPFDETKLYRNEYVYADGSLYWEQYEYFIDSSDGCKRTTIYTDSHGNSQTEEMSESHYTQYHSEWLEDPTCTQSGSYVECSICRLCGKVTDETIYERQPLDHYWSYNSEKQIYVCARCDLESENGTSGSIWLEDLSTDENYVVGYYCKSDISFSPYVSLILYDAAEGENDEIVLNSVVVNYLTAENGGVRGLSFSKASAAEAAATALEAAGYTGRYAVRISCVPIGSEDTLDYAVTFETLAAE